MRRFTEEVEEEKRKLAERKAAHAAEEREEVLALRVQLEARVRKEREQPRHKRQKESLEQLEQAKEREVRKPFPFAAIPPRQAQLSC